ncbi:hypothetical protein A3G50_00680 [Candidatus Jorgensenbacteria bacterium RIFCSPLOWO2_12_FULL_42_11]|uniref:Uncharacterized protein n=1 Tax=Candidatus Jorgensenbacteria bacterium RIFCSPLOWO2_12_FULL_42_11 TaxID=1798473 RepID=A0A1F6C155_9BACT|nr:MAG: hypothetical protein A3G50_00680 [Candidatus Jorgensenbacteria bacterium RIFCSPLOWO2_12_FULL_42_11]
MPQARVLTIVQSEVLKATPVDVEIKVILFVNDEDQDFKVFEIQIILKGNVFSLKQHYFRENEALEKYEEIRGECKKYSENKKGESDGPAHKGTEK